MSNDGKTTSKKGKGTQPANLKKGKKFSAHYQPSKRRKPSAMKLFMATVQDAVETEFSKKYALSDADIDACIVTLLRMSVKEVASIVNNTATPLFITLIGRTLITEAKGGKFHYSKDLIERVFGAVKQNVDVTSKGDKVKGNTQVYVLPGGKEVKW